MIGQEGSYSQLMKSTVNRPAPTTEQIKKSTAPIVVPITNLMKSIKDKAKATIENVKSTLTPIVFWGVVGLIAFTLINKK